VASCGHLTHSPRLRAEMESSRPAIVGLGLETQVLGLGLGLGTKVLGLGLRIQSSLSDSTITDTSLCCAQQTVSEAILHAGYFSPCGASF